MTITQIDDLRSRLDAARTVFEMGQRSLPFLEEVVTFLREISPLLNEITNSIQDSRDKFPKATTQLESVSQATEMAATEILDLVDSAGKCLSEIKASSEQGIRREQALQHADERLMEALRAGLKGRDDDLLETIERMNSEREKIRGRHVELSPCVGHAVDDLHGMLSRITVSLQVQDITSQQLAAVNNLIESIQRRMDALVQHLNTEGPRSSTETLLAEPANTFDPDARYEHSGDRQALADAVFSGDGAGLTEVAQVAPGTADLPTGAGSDACEINGDAAPAYGPEAKNPGRQNDTDTLFSAGH